MMILKFAKQNMVYGTAKGIALCVEGRVEIRREGDIEGGGERKREKEKESVCGRKQELRGEWVE